MDADNSLNDNKLTELPLFPLNIVLMPNMPIPLHIFEERYKIMIGRCILENSSFGILLIKEGAEVGGGAKPFDVGTTAHIDHVERLPEGQINIVVHGERRFRLINPLEEIPYSVGLVEYIPEPDGIITDEAFDTIQKLFAKYKQGVAGLRGGWSSQANIRMDPQHLSYAIASYLQLPNQIRQQLLEISTTSERLSQEIPLLERAVSWIRNELVKRSPFIGPRLN